MLIAKNAITVIIKPQQDAISVEGLFVLTIGYYIDINHVTIFDGAKYLKIINGTSPIYVPVVKKR